MAYDPNLPIDSELVKNLPAAIREKGASLKELIDALESSFNEHKADYASQSNKTYYIDAVNGNDNNDGLTPATAFKTWAKCVSIIPKFILHPYIIYIIGNLPEVIEIRGKIIVPPVNNIFWVRGYTETPGNHVVNGINILGCISNEAGGLRFQYLRSTGIIRCRSSAGVSIRNIEPQYEGGIGIDVQSSILDVRDWNIGNNIVTIGINAQSSLVSSTNGQGNATQYGLQSTYASIIAKNGTQPTGTVANEKLLYGGEIR